MPISIRTARVREALQPFLGADTLMKAPVAEHAAEVLRHGASHQPPEELARQLSDLLFSELYACLGPRMTVRLDDGRQVRIRMADIPDLADGVLGVWFDSLPESDETLRLLRAYAMQTTSLSAMRALLTRFHGRQSPEELTILRRIVRDNYPPERYAPWLG